MTWAEAFSRAFGGVVALIGIYISAVILMAIGGAVLASESNIIMSIVGGVILLAGLGVMLLGGLATMLKLLTDSVTDNVVSRIERIVRSQPDQRPTPAASPTTPQPSRPMGIGHAQTDLPRQRLPHHLLSELA